MLVFNSWPLRARREGHAGELGQVHSDSWSGFFVLTAVKEISET